MGGFLTFEMGAECALHAKADGSWLAWAFAMQAGAPAARASEFASFGRSRLLLGVT